MQVAESCGRLEQRDKDRFNFNLILVVKELTGGEILGRQCQAFFLNNLYSLLIL